jgi:serine/threonine protein kinase
LLALLQHENIVRVHGLTYIEDRLAILMEPIDGADLSKLREAAPIRAALEVIEATADALWAAWETVPPNRQEPLRVVHRDIKPSNIMITSRGGVKVMDFGVARATFKEREVATKSQQYGTARYMAPERWLYGSASTASDVYSLGITLAEIATAEPVARLRLSPEGFKQDREAVANRLTAWPEVRALFIEMCAYEEEKRLSASDVAARCRGLYGILSSPGLKDWCYTWGPCQAQHQRDFDSTVVLEDDGKTYDVDSAPTGNTEEYSEEHWEWPSWWVLILYGAMIEAVLVSLAGIFSAMVNESQSPGTLGTSPQVSVQFEVATNEAVVAPFGEVRGGEIYKVDASQPFQLSIGEGDQTSHCTIAIGDKDSAWRVDVTGNCLLIE